MYCFDVRNRDCHDRNRHPRRKCFNLSAHCFIARRSTATICSSRQRPEQFPSDLDGIRWHNQFRWPVYRAIIRGYLHGDSGVRHLRKRIRLSRRDCGSTHTTSSANGYEDLDFADRSQPPNWRAAAIYCSRLGTSNTAVTWSASAGTIATNGLYTAPSAAGTYTISAISKADTSKFASAIVIVSANHRR